MAMKSGRLTHTFVKSVKAGNKPKRYGDGPGGHGLSLLVKETKTARSSKTWAQRIRINGKLKTLGLGSWPVVTLADVRATVLDNARRVARGEDILKPPPSIPTVTVDEVFDIVIDQRRPSWKGHATERNWRLSQKYCAPIGSKLVSEVRQKDVLDILTPIWQKKPTTARAIRSHLSTIMQWAINREYRISNPATPGVVQELGKQPPSSNHPSLPAKDLGSALALIRDADEWWAAKYCLIFAAFTGLRSGEVRMATWDEIDWEELTYTIPRARMKNGLEHKVPLSPQVIELLQHVRDQNTGRCEGLIFPPKRGADYMGDDILSSLMKKLDIPAPPHGFRQSFRNWAGGDPDIAQPAAEAVLAHKQGTKVERAYLTSDFFEHRLPIMDQWANFLTGTMGPIISTTPAVSGEEQPEKEERKEKRKAKRKAEAKETKETKITKETKETGDEWRQAIMPGWDGYMT